MVSCGEKYDYTKVEPDYSAHEETDVIHIGAWVAPPPAQKAGDVDYCTQEAYNDIAASGINHIAGFYECTAYNTGEMDAIERALSYAENAGINMYVCDWSFGTTHSVFLKDDAAIHARMDKYAKYKSFAGALIRDEPKVSEFETLRKIKEGWNRVFPDKEGVINLNPIVQTYAYLGLNEGETYQEHYVRRYVDEIKPQILSFDNYPMMIDGWGEHKVLSSSRSSQIRDSCTILCITSCLSN